MRGWDHHGNLPGSIRQQCRECDQASAALVKDLKQRGMLDDTLVIWGGEFGRTIYSQGMLTKDNYGRDHHPRCFTMWMAGGGMKPGMTLRPDRRLQLQRRREPGPRPRPERHDPALPGDRSPAAHLSLPGPRLPPDRRARHGDQRHSGVAGGQIALVPAIAAPRAAPAPAKYPLADAGQPSTAGVIALARRFSVLSRGTYLLLRDELQCSAAWAHSGLREPVAAELFPFDRLVQVFGYRAVCRDRACSRLPGERPDRRR